MTTAPPPPDPLADEPFAYRASKDGKAFVTWYGKTVLILKAQAAQRFLVQVAAATPADAQRIMTKITGNFKRGNERR